MVNAINDMLGNYGKVIDMGQARDTLRLEMGFCLYEVKDPSEFN